MRKIGITALAGSLASVSAAQAGSMAVSGSAELTWINQDADEVTGNPIGQKKNLSFSGSGELDNGWTFGVMHAMNDAMSGLSSSNVTLTMGSLGTIAFDAGTGGYGGTNIEGAWGGSLLHGAFDDNQRERIMTFYKNMNIIGSQ